VDAFDNPKDLEYFQQKTQKDDEEPAGKGELRRTASYSNIIQEDVKGEDEEEEKAGKQAKNYSPHKPDVVKFNLNGAAKKNGRGEKSYFDPGSVRNTA
jgi:hypothetical protein